MTRTFEEFLLEDFKNPQEALAFFQVAMEEFLENNDLAHFNLALDLLIKSQGSVTQFAKNTGISRTHLYKIFRSKSEPKLSTIKNILNELGYKLTIIPLKKVA
ncbi:MAG: helix-turn-helix domain-containing protein [Candidatus Gastranaerophilales bacterium]|nr:helix-turn-helix domain-containing protein [Candidatus Gastranaerophilales bacterium]